MPARTPPKKKPTAAKSPPKAAAKVSSPKAVAAPKAPAKGALKASPKAAPKPVPKAAPRPPPPPPPPPKPVSIEERTAFLERELQAAPAEFLEKYRENLDMSWIYHDAAIEGVVYTYQELRTAMDGSVAIVDSNMQPVCEEIRRHREALNVAREFAVKTQKAPITLDHIKKLYVTLHPEEGDIKTVRYRKDIPQHRLYFHEYAAPDKITYKMRQLVDWVNDPETKKSRSPLRLAARAHYDLLRIFPFTHDSGKVARLFLNMLLLRAGYPPAIVHSTERQRYYEALRGASAAMTTIVTEAIENNLASVEKLLEDLAAGGR